MLLPLVDSGIDLVNKALDRNKRGMDIFYIPVTQSAFVGAEKHFCFQVDLI